MAKFLGGCLLFTLLAALGARAQVVRRQPDGSWLRVLDQPEFLPPGR